METFFIIAEAVAIIMIFVAMVLLITDENGAREQEFMGYFLCGALIQNVGYLLELTAPTVEAAILSVKVQYLGSIFIPLCYCWFLYSYCHVKPPMKLLCVLGIIDLFLLLSIFTLERHDLYYRHIGWLQTEEGHNYLDLSYGPCYPLFLLCGCVVPYFLSISTLLRAILNEREYASERRYKTIMGLSLLPVLALLSYAGKLLYVFDLTPAVLGLVLSLVAILIWRRRTYDFLRLVSTALVDSMGDGVIATDIQKRIFSYNQAAAEIFPKLGDCKLGDSITALEDFPEGLLEGDVNTKFSLNGRFYESHTKQLLNKNNQAQGYVVLVLDETDTRNYIEEIKQVREQAERANMAKSEFLANMSHEIRTPMNAIIGLSDIILEESKGRKLYSYAGDIKAASQDLLALINDILDLSKIEAGKMELVTVDYHVKNMVNDVVRMMDIAASKRGLLMKREYDESIPSIYHGDEGRIKQILINLLNNAIKFTKEGYVKIRVGGAPGKTENEEILTFQVIDTGCGIREEDREKIFENFRQVDSKRNRSAEGTGLGLSITRRLVELMGGRIEVESVYGEGSTFTVTIPQRIVDRRSLSELPEMPAREMEKVETFIADSMKVLVVDDNRINRKVARGFLDVYHFQLEEAASGFEAIDLVRQTAFDIIFMDHMMPEMDGLEAARIIREECGENGRTPVIIALTANAMEGVREMFLANGFQDFLTKPLEKKSLNDTLLKWVPAERRRKPDYVGYGRKENPELDLSGIHIEGIDSAAAAKYQSGTMEDYIELLKLYCLDGARKLKLLKKLYEEENYGDYGIEVHGLKSASANVGAMSLSALARAHEEAADRGDGIFITEHFAELTEAFERQMQCIQDFLKGGESATGENGAGDLPEIDREKLTELVGKALEQLENFHSKECAAGIEELLGYRLEADIAAKLEEVQGQLKLYEDTEAERLLGRLLEEL